MMQSDKTQTKKIVYFIISILAIAAIIITVILCFRRSGQEEVATLLEQNEVVEVKTNAKATSIAGKKVKAEVEVISIPKQLIYKGQNSNVKVEESNKDIELYIANKDNISMVFQRQNIIPIRCPRTEERTENSNTETENSGSFFGKLKSFFSSEKKKVEEAVLLDIPTEEKFIQLNSSENIIKNYRGKLVDRINKLKSAEKQIEIIAIREKVLELGNILPSDASTIEDLDNVFWLHTYTTGDLVLDWMAYTLELTELVNIRQAILNLEKSEKTYSEVRKELINIVKGFVQKVASNTGIGGVISTERENITKLLREYKSTQEMLKKNSECNETEKLLVALDTLSYIIPMTTSSNDKIKKSIQHIESRVKNMVTSHARKQVNDYLSATKKYNQEIIESINEYMRFMADLTQYIGVTMIPADNLKNIEQMNSSTYAYDFDLHAPASDVIAGVNDMLSDANGLFKNYMKFLNLIDKHNAYAMLLVDFTDGNVVPAHVKVLVK